MNVKRPLQLEERTRERLIEVMEVEGVNAADLSRLSGVSDRTIRRFMKGEQSPSLGMCDRLFAGLGYDVYLVVE